MEKIFVSVKYETRQRNFAFTLLAVLCFIGLLFLVFYMRNVYSQAREDLIDRLRKEKEVAEINNNLRSEYSAMTQSRFLEMEAKRIGLKKAAEEEVLVLR